MKITILGCGPSWGVPRIGGDWGACDPAEPRNRRTRASIMVEDQGAAILVDTSPDLRQQLLTAGISRIDALIYTHAHADHMHGIDEMRAVSWLMGKKTPTYGSPRTLKAIDERFGYAFHGIKDPEQGTYYYPPFLEPLEVSGPFTAAGVPIVPIDQAHGRTPSLGLRFGRFAYSTDVASLDETAFASLAGIELWVVDCIREKPHPTHSHLAQTLAWIERVRPRRAILTHMDQSLDFQSLRRTLPGGVEPAHDGMILEI